MKWSGTTYWVLLYGGCAILVWAVADVWAFLIFLAGLALAVLSLMLADWMTRERTPKRRITHDDA